VSYTHREYSMGFSVAAVVADAWERELRESPDPFDDMLIGSLFDGPRLSYRERLDRQSRNHFGEIIPRIVTVRRNMRLMQRPCVTPRLPQ
jgi:hypothetical protein